MEDEQISCEKLYPNHYRNFTTLISVAKSLLSTNLDIINNTVLNLLNGVTGTVAILIKETKLIPIVENSVRRQSDKNIKIVSINSVKNDKCFDNLIILGSPNPNFYPEFIFSSPRAKIIHIVKYRWMKGVWRPRNAFPNPLRSNSLPNIINEEDETALIGEAIDPEFILPIIDFSSIVNKAEQEYLEDDDDTEYVDAIISYLENEQVVFLDFDDNSSVRIVDLEGESSQIKKVMVRELEPDIYILLRTSGGGDYIVPIANRIMGELAENARRIQKEWKDRLRRLVRNNGMNWVVKNLRENGCRIARSNNVRNWMSYRSIKTNEFSDFNAIMKLVELGPSSHDIWQQMEIISRAHIQAGFYITKLLLNVVRTSNLDELIRLGTMEFELQDKDAGRITAFRIISISSETIKISSSKTGIPFNAGE